MTKNVPARIRYCETTIDSPEVSSIDSLVPPTKVAVVGVLAEPSRATTNAAKLYVAFRSSPASLTAVSIPEYTPIPDCTESGGVGPGSIRMTTRSRLPVGTRQEKATTSRKPRAVKASSGTAAGPPTANVLVNRPRFRWPSTSVTPSTTTR